MKNFETLEVGKTYRNSRGGEYIIEKQREDGYFQSRDELFTPGGLWFMGCDSMNLVELVEDKSEKFEPVGFLWRSKGSNDKWKFEHDVKQCESLSESLLVMTEVKIVYEKL